MQPTLWPHAIAGFRRQAHHELEGAQGEAARRGFRRLARPAPPRHLDRDVVVGAVQFYGVELLRIGPGPLGAGAGCHDAHGVGGEGVSFAAMAAAAAGEAPAARARLKVPARPSALLRGARRTCL